MDRKTIVGKTEPYAVTAQSCLNVEPLKSDSKKFIPAFWRDLDYKGKKELFISHAIVIEYFHFKSVLAFQLHQRDMVST